MAGGGFLPLFEECRAEENTRTVLHSDLNNFFASVEIARDPSLAPYPGAVCGSIEERHGIVLAKNQLAQAFGIRSIPAVMYIPLKGEPAMTLGARDKAKFEKEIDAYLKK